MNPGLQGFGGVGIGVTPLAVYAVSASATYATNPEPVVDTTVKDDGGSVAMTLGFTLPVASRVLVRIACRITKSSAGRTRVRVYDNGVAIAPRNGTLSDWYGHYVRENSLHQLRAEWLVPLQSGAHVLDIRHQAALSTATVTWGDRLLVATVLP